MNDKINNLKSNLKSVQKQKMHIERDVGKLRVTSSSLCNELFSVKSELEHLTNILEESKSKISNGRHQLEMIDICTASEKSKVSSHIGHLNVLKQGFDEQLNREREHCEQREKELREREAEELECDRVRREAAAIRSEQGAREAAALAAESDALEQACAVLKKRNNAIMLKLRRKLVETENARRDLIKFKDEISD